DTDALTFGKPITLRVEPKDVPPTNATLSILTSEDKTETLCLAAGFSPKEGDLSLFLGEKDSHKSVENAVLSTEDKTYYYAAFSKDGIDRCEMKGESITKGEGQAKETPKLPNCDQPGGNNVPSPNNTSYNAIMSH
ncbi:T-cell receptor delta, partial [Clarias magur]